MSNGWTGGQYSFVRIVTAAWLLMWLVLLVARVWSDSIVAAWLLGGAGLLAVAALATGVAVKPCGLALAALNALLIGWTHAVWLSPFAWGVALLLVALPCWHAFVPTGGFASLPGRGNEDPAGGWWMPQSQVVAARWLLAVTYLVLGCTLLLEESWRIGEALQATRQAAGEATLAPLPLGLSVWGLIAAWLLASPLIVAVPIARQAVWWMLPAVGLVLLPLVSFATGPGEGGGAVALLFALLAAHLAAFEPHWLSQRVFKRPEDLFYDGHCGFCHNSVRVVLAEDQTGRLFVVAPREGDWFQQRLSKVERDTLPRSIAIRTIGGKLLTRSDAVLHILDRLGGLWRIVAWCGGAIPRPVRDAAYKGIAAVRYHLAGRREEVCPVMAARMRKRFRA